MLLLSLLSIPCGVVALTLLVLHNVLQQQIRRELSADLVRSISTFRNIQAQREQMLEREVGLLAALPVLKSLMTTSDDRTIRDGSTEFYQLSRGDLFVLADPTGRPIAVFESGVLKGAADLDPVPSFNLPNRTSFYRTRSQQLYAVAFRPLYFGEARSGILLGYVMLGYAVDRRLAEEVSQAASAQVIFFVQGTPAATTLSDRTLAEATRHSDQLLSSAAPGNDIWLGGEHFVHASVQLGEGLNPRVEMVALESYDKASQYVKHLDLSLVIIGAVLLALGGTLAVVVSTSITRPLDRLVAGARALGGGNFDYHIQRTGAQELQELADAFDRMRHKLRSAREELLAAERLATIGRMASSISHDLRHYLSAVYANAEFLGYDSTRPEERHELMSEVRQGVRGMTDLIDSLLLFSRTGESLQPTCESLPFLVERALTMVRAHPDAHDVQFVISPICQAEAWLDARQVERALYNLLLNGCQAARLGSRSPEVQIACSESDDQFTFFITDNGPGVPDSARETLFQPFVSVGKPSGTGLGLTLSLKIAQEHGGSVTLQASRDGMTVFQLTLAKSVLRGPGGTSRRRDVPTVIR